jgi:hypothetical protein
VQAVIEVPVKEEEEEEGYGGEGPRYLETEPEPKLESGMGGVSRPDPVAVLPYPTTISTSTGNGRSSARRRKSSAASSSHHRRSLVAPSKDGSYGGARGGVGVRVGVGVGVGAGVGGYIDDEGEEPRSDESDSEPEPDDDGCGGEYVDEEDIENALMTNGGMPAMTTTTMTGRKATVPWGRKHIRHEPDEEDDELMMYAKVRFPLLSFPPFRLVVSCFADAIRFAG